MADLQAELAGVEQRLLATLRRTERRIIGGIAVLLGILFALIKLV